MNTLELKLQTVFICCFLSLSLSASDVNFRTLSIAEAITEAEIQNKHLFVSYEADWCVPCQIMEERVFSNETVVSKLNSDYVSVKVNYDELSDKEWFGTYDVSSLPTITIVNDIGKELTRHEGTMNLATFLAFLDSNAKHPKPIEKPSEKPARVIAAQYKNVQSTALTTIQFGAFSKFANAQRHQQSIESLLNIPTVITTDDSGLYRLLYNESITKEERRAIIANANDKKLDFFIK